MNMLPNAPQGVQAFLRDSFQRLGATMDTRQCKWHIPMFQQKREYIYRNQPTSTLPLVLAFFWHGFNFRDPTQIPVKLLLTDRLEEGEAKSKFLPTALAGCPFTVFLLLVIRMSNNTLNLIGWILFIISAIGFIISSIGSFWAMFGSVFFLVACLVFLIPFFRKDSN